ncbi:MAG: TIGR03118 family protein [Acidobacteriota bacterium]|nr:TIGR03118 family protein [Acidobacteriota bacterium]
MFRSQKSSPQTTNRLVLSVAFALAAGALLSQPAAAQSATVHLISANPNTNLVDATPVNLISDIVDVGANPATPDTNLVNPWGLVASAKGPWWVSDNGSGHSTLYDGTGSPIPLVVSIPQWDGTPGGSPTGIVFNGTSDFAIGGNATHFLFATEDGTIQGWSSDGSTVIAVNNFPGAVYKGLALASAGGANYLYVANFRAGSVDVFDKNFAPHSFGPDAFLDFSMPAGYAPFNVANVGDGKLAVTYALQDGVKHDDVAGIGHGYVIIYDTEGKRLFRLQHVPYLNSPWAVVVAPRIGFGAFGGDFLVGQFGSGAIVAYDSKGNFEGLLFDPAALPLRINGLWGLGFGNGASSGPTTTLYFTAGVFDEAHGIFGSITCCSAPSKTW